jgi:hypothetical protein
MNKAHLLPAAGCVKCMERRPLPEGGRLSSPRRRSLTSFLGCEA